MADDIFVVTTDEYSSMYVDAVFTLEDDAATYCTEMNKRNGYDTYQYERIDLNPPLPAVVRAVTEPEPEPEPEPEKPFVRDPDYNLSARVLVDSLDLKEI